MKKEKLTDATSLKEYVLKNKESVSQKCWEVLIQILNDRDDGMKYELSNPQ